MHLVVKIIRILAVFAFISGNFGSHRLLAVAVQESVPSSNVGVPVMQQLCGLLRAKENMIKFTIGQALPFLGPFVKIAGIPLSNKTSPAQDIYTSLMEAFCSGKDWGFEPQCKKDLIALGSSLLARQYWALQMLDSWGKPGAGVLSGNLRWMGNFDQCIEARPVIPQSESSTFKAKYCRSLFPIPSAKMQSSLTEVKGSDRNLSMELDIRLSVGICVPSTCQSKELTNFLQIIGKGAIDPEVVCREPSELIFPNSALVAVGMTVLLAAVLTVCTLYDFLHNRCTVCLCMQTDKLDGSSALSSEEGMTVRSFSEDMSSTHYEERNTKFHDRSANKAMCLFHAFSLRRHVPRLFRLYRTPTTLTSLDGARVLAMCWIVLSHVYFYSVASGPGIQPTVNPRILLQKFKEAAFQLILSGALSVDTFLFISGVLLSYQTLRALSGTSESRTRVVSLVKYFPYLTLHRILRLLPLYSVVIMFFSCLLTYIEDGPFWSWTMSKEVENCQLHWWRNILFINNFFPMENMCMIWSWFLSVDMQLYLFSTLILLFFLWKGKAGILITALLTILSMVIHGLQMSAEGSIGVGGLSMASFFENIYTMPWTRYSPFGLGVLAGYIILRLRQKNVIHIKLGRSKEYMLLTFGWTVALILLGGVIFVDYSQRCEGCNSWTTTFSNAFYSCRSTLWAISLCWIAVACNVPEWEGIAARLLSWSVLAPLSRVTYSVYLIHSIVIYVFYYSLRAPLAIHNFTMVIIYLGVLFFSYLIGIVLTVTIEYPMMSLEKYITFKCSKLREKRTKEKKKNSIQDEEKVGLASIKETI